MTVYFEGDGKSRPVTLSECRDHFVNVVKEMRDDVLNNPELESYDDTCVRDGIIADRIITGMLDICDGNNPNFPAINLIPYENTEDTESAKAAGANYIDNSEFADFGGGLAEYWRQVSS